MYIYGADGAYSHWRWFSLFHTVSALGTEYDEDDPVLSKFSGYPTVASSVLLSFCVMGEIDVT